jgi:integrase
MAARPRIRKRANWPANMHEPRPGYYSWRDPRDGKTHVLGRMPLAQAIYEAQEANAIVANGKVTKTLAERLAGEQKAVSDLIAKMPTDGFKPSTLAARKSYDDVIRKELGKKVCSALTVKDVSDVIEAIKARGKLRWAQAIRSRMVAIFAKGVALGWMEKNPAAITEKMTVKVQRRRLTLEEFNLILKKAPKVAEWLPNAMLLALVSGQDRSTIARWERASVVGDVSIVRRSKTEVRIAIPLALRMNAIGLSLQDVIDQCNSTGVESQYLIHHHRKHVNTFKGQHIKIGSVSQAFADARELAGIKGDNAPTFHEIRSLTKRLYVEQGGVDTKALLGHASQQTADLYANSRGLEPVKVKIE